MRRTAAKAPNLLRDATGRAIDFLRSQIHDDGGFRDRAGAGDLYYTAFGIESLAALKAEWSTDTLDTYLRAFGTGSELDFVHQCCLARCWTDLDNPPDFTRLAQHIEEHRTRDGGYNAATGEDTCTAYDCFLALGAYQDLNRPMPEPDRFISAINMMAHDTDQPRLTPILAATIALCCELNQSVPASLIDDVMSCRRSEGGFVAAPKVPIPDLLSTATALHALQTAGADLAAIREPCLNFLDTLWSEQGGFCGSAMDNTIDCEYTYYGLLALGNLSI
jgi:prenyltransferase beta subunit